MTPVSNLGKDFIAEHSDYLAKYYQAMLEGRPDNREAEQERFNRDDLLDIARGTWDDLTPAQRGLIALLCNELL